MFSPDLVLDLWFPDTGHQKSVEAHGAFWDERMQGGMDTTIIHGFADRPLPPRGARWIIGPRRRADAWRF